MLENICHFIPYRNDYNSLHTINFVLETETIQYSGIKPCCVYRVYYIKDGTGKLHTHGKVIPLKKNDVFIVFPDFAHSIESEDNFSFMYISFLGSRANMILDKLKITTANFFFENCSEILKFCEYGINTAGENSDWIAESVLLFTFSCLSQTLFPSETRKKEKNNVPFIIKKFIDDNFSDSNLSLAHISSNISYSPKYISGIFKKEFKIGINEYINALRIQHACTLMNQGFTSITDISAQCGFEDPQYFSKVFKAKMEIPPKEYLRGI